MPRRDPSRRPLRGLLRMRAAGSPLHAHAEQEYRRVVVDADRRRGTQPFLAHFAFDLHVTIELVGDRGRHSVTIVLAVRANVVVEAVAELDRADEPAAERMI